MRKKSVFVEFSPGARWTMKISSGDAALRDDIIAALQRAKARGIGIVNVLDPFGEVEGPKPRKASAKEVKAGQDGKRLFTAGKLPPPPPE